MKKIEMTEFLNGVATFNADPYCVEDEVMARSYSMRHKESWKKSQMLMISRMQF